MQESDEESFEEDDEDRDRIYQPNDLDFDFEDQDNRPRCQETLQPGVTLAGFGNLNSDNEETTATTSSDYWQSVEPDYVVPTDIIFTEQAHVTVSLPLKAALIDIFNLLLIDEIVKLMVTETNQQIRRTILRVKLFEVKK